MKLKKRKSLFVAFLMLAGIGAFFAKPVQEVKAATVNVYSENNSSNEIRVNLEDYIVFHTNDLNYRYTFYSNENGTKVFPFGNGKYWAAEAGTALIIISGTDKDGKDSYIADYKIVISNEKSVPKIVEEKKTEPIPEPTPEPNPTPQPTPEPTPIPEQEETDEQVDMSLVTIEGNEMVENRVIRRTRDKRYSNFNFAINSPVTLSPKTNAKVTFKNNNPSMKYLVSLKNRLYIGVEGVGEDVLTVTINGKDFPFYVSISEESLSETTAVLAPGDTYTFSYKGASQLPVIWNSEDPDVAVINENGVVTAISEGHSIITAMVGETKFAAVVSVTTPIKRDVVHYTSSYSSKSRYSQPRRMQNGYYDCSSLVWRAYNKFGHSILLGKGSPGAPVASAMGRYYTENDKLIEGGVSRENIDSMAFEPGDLLFVEGTVENRRFKKVNHVEMIYGYSIEGFDAENNPILGIRYANNHQSKFKGFVGRPNTDEDETGRYRM